MKRTGQLAPILLCLLIFTGSIVSCQTTPVPRPEITVTPPPVTLSIGLSDSASAFGRLAEEGYSQEDREVRLHFIKGNDQTLLADLEDGILGAVLVYQVLDDQNIWFSPVALDGLVIIGHPNGPIDGLNLAETKSLFAGAIKNWITLGGIEEKVQTISREGGAGARVIFEERVMAGQPIAGSTLIAPSLDSMLAMVMDEPGALGFDMMGSLESGDLFSVDGIEATKATTANQSYPLTAPLYFVSIGEPEGEMRAFLSWLQSSEGQMEIGEKYGRVR